MGNERIDRMAITIVSKAQSHALIRALNENGLPATLIDSRGGFLHDAMVTLLVGVPASRLPRFFSIVREKCPSRTRYVSMGAEFAMAPGYPMMVEARVGGATAFIIPIERFVQL